MSELRDITRRYVEDETLRDYLESEYETTSTEKKERLLNTLRRRGEIDRQVDYILDAFRVDIEKNSPRSKRRKTWNIFYAVFNLLFTILIAYTVNITNWPVVWGLFVASVLVNVFYVIQSDE